MVVLDLTTYSRVCSDYILTRYFLVLGVVAEELNENCGRGSAIFSMFTSPSFLRLLPFFYSSRAFFLIFFLLLFDTVLTFGLPHSYLLPLKASLIRKLRGSFLFSVTCFHPSDIYSKI